MTIEESLADLARRAAVNETVVRKGRVSSVDSTQRPWIFTVEGRPMPMLGSADVGDLVAWIDQAQPIGLGKFIIAAGTDSGGGGGDPVGSEEVRYSLSFMFDLYNHEPVGVMGYNVFRAAQIRGLAFTTTGKLGDRVTFDVIVNGSPVTSISGGDVVNQQGAALAIPVAAGSYVTVTPKTIVTNPPEIGNIQVFLEED